MYTKKLIAGCLLLILCTFSYSQQAEAAGPVSHAFLTELFFKKHQKYNDIEKDLFRLGSLFPNVRFLAPFPQEGSEFSIVDINEVLNETSPFIAGMKFNAFVDHWRDDYINSTNATNLLKDLPLKFKTAYLKFIEDELVYDLLNRDLWLNNLQSASNEELAWGYQTATIDEWHRLLRLAFTFTPKTLVALINLKGKGLLHIPPEEISLWFKHFKKTSERKDIQAYVNNIMKSISSKMGGG